MSTPVTHRSKGGGTKQGWPGDGDSTALVSAQPGATLQPWEAMGVGEGQALQAAMRPREGVEARLGAMVPKMLWARLHLPDRTASSPC